MDFDWDDDKNETNRDKHGVDFEEAMTVFFGVYFEVRDSSPDEQRFKAIGFSAKTRTLVVVYCYREPDIIRIISARKATAKERSQYGKK